MSYKNTMKLFVSNFMLVWKQVLYLAICFMLFVLCTYSTTKPIIELLRENNIIEELKLLIDKIYNTPSEIALEFSVLLKHLINVILENIGDIWLSLIGFILLGIFLPYMLIQMSFYNITSILHQKLSMNMNVNYIQNGVHTLRQSIRFAFSSIIIGIPFLVITIVLFEIYLTIARTTITAIIGLVILFALLIFATSIQITLYTYFIGHMVDKNSNPFVSFGKGTIQSLKHFWKIMSQSVILTLTVIFVNGFICLFTFFSGLIVTIPATFVLLALYYLVVYFNIKGERYYLSNNMIFNPIKYKVKQDNFIGSEIPEITKETELTTVVMKKRKTSKKNKSNSKSNKKG